VKAMLLAAGRGERMGSLTENCPKPLLRVAGKPLIEHHVERLVRAGFRQVVINVCYLADQIMAYLGDGGRWGISIQYSKEMDCLETGGGIHRALPLLLEGSLGQEPFLVLNCDVWTDYPLEQLMSMQGDMAHQSTVQPVIQPIVQQAHLVLVPNPDHNITGDFGFVEKSKSVYATSGVTNETTYTFSGISVLQPSLFEGCSSGRFALAPLLRDAMSRQAVAGEVYAGIWVDVGTPERLSAVNEGT